MYSEGGIYAVTVRLMLPTGSPNVWDILKASSLPPQCHIIWLYVSKGHVHVHA